MTHVLSRRAAMTLAASALAAPTLVHAAQTPVLVELFTSQGCSSCPPADAIMGQLKKRDGLIVTSLNVDYWDYLGWRDTLAKPEYTERQRDYAAARGDGQVYTPQVVVNGRYHAVGSRLSDVEDAIEKARRKPANLAVSIRATQSEILVDLPDGSYRGEAMVWLMAVAPKIDQKIERGENTGATVSYHNVVRNFVPAGMWQGAAASLTFMKSAIMPKDSSDCFVVVQDGKTGPVLGLARHRTIS